MVNARKSRPELSVCFFTCIIPNLRDMKREIKKCAMCTMEYSQKCAKCILPKKMSISKRFYTGITFLSLYDPILVNEKLWMKFLRIWFYVASSVKFKVLGRDGQNDIVFGEIRVLV